MEELIQVGFFLLIIIASLADGIRKQRKKHQAPDIEPYGSGEDDRLPAPPLPDPAKSTGSVLPEDLWEEIRALSRGETPGGRASAEGAGPSGPELAPGFPIGAETGTDSGWRELEREPETSRIQTWGPSASAEEGREVLWQSGSAGELFPRVAPLPSPHASPSPVVPIRPSPELVRTGVRLKGIADLRRAILMKEILGRPRGLRPPQDLPMDG